MENSGIQSFDHQLIFQQEIYPQSPAATAGLEAKNDYVVGTPQILFNDSEDFFNFIEANYGKKVNLYVYSARTDEVRMVIL